ncbi:MAG: PilZ domain-containing protein [Bryobacteraceae bacterium]|nr:PilZ domain-containing protein [Bryobacteraceae bacterium]
MLCADLVTVVYQDAAGQPQETTANLEDISTNGVCLQVEEELPLGTPVRIQHSRGTFAGEVRYCKYSEPVGYFLGVEFAADSHWSRSQFKPLHMLDPRRLVQRSLERATKNVS